MCGAEHSLVIPKANDNPVMFSTPAENNFPTSSGEIHAYFGDKIFPSS
jgi:hypothetical protein